jgi:aspartyl aminopeptidase
MVISLIGFSESGSPADHSSPLSSWLDQKMWISGDLTVQLQHQISITHGGPNKELHSILNQIENISIELDNQKRALTCINKAKTMVLMCTYIFSDEFWLC